MEQTDQKIFYIKNNIYLIIEEIFKASLVTYFILLMAEEFNKGLIKNYFNLNIILTIVILSGVGTVLLNSNSQASHKKNYRKAEFAMILTVSVIGGVIIFFKLYDIGVVAYVISFLTIVLIFSISILIINDKDDENDSRS